ncbi:63_t:CDS:2 [Acaulospora colombiana]|uniref:63_t:CDS:1 n=1 Tax=Acaulospora colombiana TaxID=27376 RepID=A0ACA9ME82_9GLOM|nr:63_t:CDS:2 [Acaulospora colombiana]
MTSRHPTSYQSLHAEIIGSVSRLDPCGASRLRSAVISRLNWMALGFVLTSLALDGDERQLTWIGKENEGGDYLFSIGNDRTSNQILQGGSIQNGRGGWPEMGRLLYKSGASAKTRMEDHQLGYIKVLLVASQRYPSTIFPLPSPGVARLTFALPSSTLLESTSLAMDFTYTYGASDVSHTKAKAGDTDRWAASLSPLLDVNKSTSMSHRELIKMDTTVLDIEMKKASVTRSELERRLSVRSLPTMPICSGQASGDPLPYKFLKWSWA